MSSKKLGGKNGYEQVSILADAHIKAGELHLVPALFSNMNFARVPRKWRQPLAKICRRAGLVGHGLRLLRPIVLVENRAALEPARPGELAEYAVLLTRIGAFKEALRFLSSIDTHAAPEALLYLGFANVSQWNYERALPHFEKHLSKLSDPYARLITDVNIASCFVHVGDAMRANEQLTKALENARSLGASRLTGNCLEMRAQISILAGDLEAAAQDLNAALAVFSESQASDRLVIQKWQAVIRSSKTNSIEPLLEFRQQALRLQHWESFRDSDFLLLKQSFDEDRFQHLIFGTPHEAYQWRLVHAFSKMPDATYTIGAGSAKIMDLTSRSDETSDSNLRSTLLALTRDQYGPRNLGALFADIYPDEHFDINSSPHKLRQAIRRARRWLESKDFKVRIAHEKGGYRLEVSNESAVKFEFLRTRNEPIVELARIFAFQTFTTAEACSALGVSTSCFHRAARESVEGFVLERTGKGKATRYKIRVAA